MTIYTPNIGASTYKKQMLTDVKGEIDSNTPLTSMNRLSRQIILTFHPKSAKYTLFSSAHRSFSRIGYVRPQKVLIQLKKNRIV